MDSSTAGNRGRNELVNIIYVAEAAQRLALCDNAKHGSARCSESQHKACSQKSETNVAVGCQDTKRLP